MDDSIVEWLQGRVSVLTNQRDWLSTGAHLPAVQQQLSLTNAKLDELQMVLEKIQKKAKL